jgi:pimeloyl-ACP methyl ester carboxylesterase
VPSSDTISKQTIDLLSSDVLDVIHGVLPEEHKDSLSLLGVSMGGMVSLNVSTKIPVKNLFLTATTFGGHESLPNVNGKFFGTFKEFSNDSSESDSDIVKSFVVELLGPVATTNYGKRMVDNTVQRFIQTRSEHGSNGSSASINAQLNALRKFDGYKISEGLLNSDHAPENICVAHADGDSVIPSQHGQHMLTHLNGVIAAKPSIGTKVSGYFPDSSKGVEHGHFLHVTNAREYCDFVNQFAK